MNDITIDEGTTGLPVPSPDELTKLQAPLDKLMAGLSVDNVFGTPEEKDGVTVIPVAEITAGLGFGYGSAPVTVTRSSHEAERVVTGEPGASVDRSKTGSADDAALVGPPIGTPYDGDARVHGTSAGAAGAVSGAGGGGGGAGQARPVGFIRLDQDGARFVGITDESKVALAGMALAGWSVVWISVAVGVVARAITHRRSA